MTTINLKQTHFALHLGQGTTKGVHCDVSGTHRYKYFASPFALPFEEEDDFEEPEHDVGLKNQDQRTYTNNGSQTNDRYIRPTMSDEDIAVMKRGKEIRRSVELERTKRQQERKDQEASLPPIVDSRSAEMYRNFLEENERKDFALREKELDDSIERKLEAKKEDLKKRYYDEKNNFPVKQISHVSCMRKATAQGSGKSMSQSKILRKNNDAIRQLHRYSSIERETKRKQWEGTDVSRRKQKEALDLISSHLN